MGAVWVLALSVSGGWGCATPEYLAISPNPLPVPLGNSEADFETIWRQTVNVVDEYFDIETENRAARRIVTKPQHAATLLEPFQGDSIGFYDRLLNTFQSYRRYAVVTVDPTSTGWAVKARVYRELENVPQPDPTQLMNFADDQFDLVSNAGLSLANPGSAGGGRGRYGEDGAAGGRPGGRSGDDRMWLPRGRDTNLEQVILDKIRRALFL